MKTRVPARTGIGVAIIACSVLIGGALTGAARADIGQADAMATLAAVQSVAPEAVSNMAAAKETGDAALVATTANGTISLPADASSGVQYESQGPVPGATIGLPFADQASDATTTSSGVVVYDNNNGSSTVPVVHDDGSVQITTVLEDASAPTRYDYPLSLAAGHTLQVTTNGGASIVDKAGNAVGTIDAPWAKDANGNAVPTSYQVHGNTLTQVVHVTASTAFPVVADPTYHYWWGGKVWLKQSDVSVTKVSALTASFLGAGFVGLLTAGALEICDNAGKGIWFYYTYAGQIWCTGP